jgi:hypothetical protein
MAKKNAPNNINPEQQTQNTKQVDERIQNGLPFSKISDASGGWSQFPDTSNTSPAALGGESLMTLKFPIEGRNYTITALKGRSTNGDGYVNPNVFVDAPGEKPWYENTNYDSRNPTTTEIINWATETEKNTKNKRPYKFTDFVFCKHWNKVPNNHMITLRRYPYAVFDNLEFPGEFNNGVQYYSPIAQAVTYMGKETGNTLGNFLKFSAGLPYEDLKSQVHNISQQQPGSDKSPFPKFAKAIGILNGGATNDSVKMGGRAPLDPYNNGPYMNRVLGPVNRIDSTKQRKPGLTFNQTFSIKFEYEARPMSGVNTKVVMLDILANLLALTYAEAAFWGGMHRFTGGRPQYPFLGNWTKLWNGDLGGYMDSVMSDIKGAGSELNKIFSAIVDNPIEGLKSLAAGGAKLGLAQWLAKKNFPLIQLPALLTGSPVGNWHLTIGNPLNPMLEIGNLVCTGIDVEFGEELGPDDFPLSMSATIKLEHGMPRDKAAIESMFNRGGGKIYHLPDEYQFGLTSGDKNPCAGGSVVDKSTAVSTSSDCLSGEKGNGNGQRRSILRGNPRDLDRTQNASIRAGKTAANISKELLTTARAGFGYYTGSNSKDNKQK